MDKKEIERLKSLKVFVRNINKQPLKYFKDYNDLSKSGKKNLKINGCYVIFDNTYKNNHKPIYIGSNSTTKRKIGDRLYQIQRCGSHPLPYRIITSKRIGKEPFGKLNKKEKKNLHGEESKSWFKDYCKRHLSYKFIEEQSNPLLIESGLIFIFKPIYNSQSKEFEEQNKVNK